MGAYLFVAYLGGVVALGADGIFESMMRDGVPWWAVVVRAVGWPVLTIWQTALCFFERSS